jgi:hypothetical protein
MHRHPKNAVINSPRFMDVVQLIAAERLRQKQLLADGKILFNCDSPIVDEDRKLRVLIAGVGDAAEAIDRLEFYGRGNKNQAATIKHELRVALIYIANAAVAWLETPDKPPGPPNPPRLSWQQPSGKLGHP